MGKNIDQPLIPQLEQFSHFLHQADVLDVPISLIGHNILGKYL